jgi:hypothetical protein
MDVVLMCAFCLVVVFACESAWGSRSVEEYQGLMTCACGGALIREGCGVCAGPTPTPIREGRAQQRDQGEGDRDHEMRRSQRILQQTQEEEEKKQGEN